MLDYVSLEQPEGGRLPDDGPHRLVMDHCRMAWMDFKEFAHSATHGAVVHALAQLKSHYPSVDLQRVATGYAQGSTTHLMMWSLASLLRRMSPSRYSVTFAMW